MSTPETVERVERLERLDTVDVVERLERVDTLEVIEVLTGWGSSERPERVRITAEPTPSVCNNIALSTLSSLSSLSRNPFDLKRTSEKYSDSSENDEAVGAAQVPDKDVSHFERLFFPQLEALTARRHWILIEQARQAGIPREAAESFWRTKRKSVRTREAA